jgi:hypothetical protein
LNLPDTGEKVNPEHPNPAPPGCSDWLNVKGYVDYKTKKWVGDPFTMMVLHHGESIIVNQDVVAYYAATRRQVRYFSMKADEKAWEDAIRKFTK